MLEMGVAVENVGPSFRSDGVFQFPHFALDAKEVIGCAKPLFEHRSAFVEIRNLVQHADLKVGLAGYGTSIGFIDPADELEESRLPGAICADQADFFGGIDLESGVSKHV